MHILSVYDDMLADKRREGRNGNTISDLQKCTFKAELKYFHGKKGKIRRCMLYISKH
jgi:hypothetical protein